MRALVVSNMEPDAAHPARGRFVRDQVAGLRRLDGVEVELFEFPPGPRSLLRAARTLRGLFGGGGFDVVHAHFGLTAWPALAVPARVRALTMHGTDLAEPRTRVATRLVLPRIDLPAAVSAELAARIPGRAAQRKAAVLPCGVDTDRFRPLDRAAARSELGLPSRGDSPLLLFAADPARAEKRYDRASAVADAVGAELLVLGSVEPERVPLLVNAANAVLVPSEREGFGLAVLEALACDVPVLATPVGIHPEALRDVPEALCAPFDLQVWRAALEPYLRADAPRIAGRAAAERWSAVRTAEDVLDAWRGALASSRYSGG